MVAWTTVPPGLELAKTSTYGYFVGVVETITATSSGPAPDAATDTAADASSN